MYDKNAKKRFFTKSSLLALQIVSVMCTGLIAPALPLMAKHYAYLPNAKLLVRLIVTVPHFVIAFTSPLVGWFFNKMDRVKVLSWVLFAYSFFGSVCFFIEDIRYIIMCRAFVGACIACTLSLSSSLIADYFDGKERSLLIGLQTTLVSIGTITYSIVAGIVADINWRYNFLIYGIPMFLIPMLRKFVVDPALNKREAREITKGEIVEPNTVVVKQDNIAISVIYFCAVFLMISYYFIPLQLPFLLDALPDMTAKKISFTLAADTLAAAIFSTQHRRLNVFLSFPRIMGLSLGLMGVSYIIIGTVKIYSIILFASFINGCGMGLTMANITLWVIHVTKPVNRGLVIGGMYSALYMGKFVSSIIIHQISKIVSIERSYIIAVYAIFCVSILLFLYAKIYDKKHSVKS
jgi:MFS family permease